MTILDKGDPTKHSAIELLRRAFNSGGKFEVQISDQTSPPIIVPFNKISNTTTLASSGAIDDYTVSVTSATGFDVGDFIAITNADNLRFYTGRVTSVVSTTIGIDCPLDFAYQAGDTVAVGSVDLSVDGSSTPQIFSLRAADPTLDVTVDVTEVVLQATCATAVDLSKFGDLTALTRGICLRRTDGTYQNLFNAKTNSELDAIGELKIYAATNPAQGVDGFTFHLDFAGQSNLGVAVRVGPDEDIQLLVQDNLLGLTSLIGYVKGHVVVD